MFRSKKIIIRGVAKKLSANIDTNGIGLLVGVHSAVINDENEFDYNYILGLLNSTLFNWFHVVKFYAARIPEGSLKYPISFLKELPIKKCNKEQQETINLLVDKILKITSNPESFNTASNTSLLKQYREKIDELVYSIYNITPNEAKYITNFKKGRTKR